MACSTRSNGLNCDFETHPRPEVRYLPGAGRQPKIVRASSSASRTSPSKLRAPASGLEVGRAFMTQLRFGSCYSAASSRKPVDKSDQVSRGIPDASANLAKSRTTTLPAPGPQGFDRQGEIRSGNPFVAKVNVRQYLLGWDWMG